MPDIQGLCGLLERHSWEPCTRIAATFKPAVGSDEDRVTLARNGLVPLLFNDNYHTYLRILSAYLLYALYDHPTQPNPFREHLLHAFQIERNKAINEEKSPQPGRAQLVFSLWRILMGGATQLSQHSPKYLSQEYLPAQYLPAALSLSFEGSGDTYREHRRTRSQSPHVDMSPALSSSSWILDTSSPRPPSRTSYTLSHRTPSDGSVSQAHVSVTEEGASGNIYGSSIIPPSATPYHPLFDGVRSGLDQPPGFGKERFAPQAPQIYQHQRMTPAQTAYGHSPHTAASNLPIHFDNYSGPVHGSFDNNFEPFTGLQMSGLAQPLSSHTYPQHFRISEQKDIPSSDLENMFVPQSNLTAYSATALGGHAPVLSHETSPLGYHRSRPVPVVATSAESHADPTSTINGSSDEPLLTRHDPPFPAPIASFSSQIPRYSPGVIGSGRPAARNASSVPSTAGYGDPLIRRESSSDRYSHPMHVQAPLPLSNMHSAEREVIRRNDEVTWQRPKEADLVKDSSSSTVVRPNVPSSPDLFSYSLYKRLSSHAGDTRPLQPEENIRTSLQETPTHITSADPSRVQLDPSLTEKLGDLSLVHNTRISDPVPMPNPTPLSSFMMKSDNAGFQLPESFAHSTNVLHNRNSQHAVRPKNQERESYDVPKQSEKQEDVQASKLPFEQRLSENRLNNSWKEFTKAIQLFIDARDRALTLAERRLLQPHLLAMTRPVCILRPSDISSLVMKNPDLAIKLLVVLLDGDDVRDTGQNSEIFDGKQQPNGYLPAEDVAQIMAEAVEHSASADVQSRLSPLPQRKDYRDALKQLPPTRQSFDVIGGLLKPAVSPKDGSDSAAIRVASIIRVEVLGEFIAGCVRWIEMAEKEEKQGELFDDRVAIATGNLCRFYFSLLSNGFLCINSEVDTAEMTSFALQFSRFDEARQLYSHIVEARA